jgi:hypothetical protein
MKDRGLTNGRDQEEAAPAHFVTEKTWDNGNNEIENI